MPKSFVKVFMQNVSMSYSPPVMEKAARKGCRWLCGNEDGGTSEWHPVVGLHTGSRFARHESEQTSYPGASLQESL